MPNQRAISCGDYSLYWGDLHKHVTGPGADVSQLDDVASYARQHLDFFAVLCYPFKWYRKGREGGIREETVGNDPEFNGWWEQVQAVSEDHLDSGEFVTFPAYEWNGNRRQWGDHNVIYLEEGQPLDDEWEFPDLCANMADRDALLIPHHTGYLVGERGKDWDEFDPSLSPVMEVYSGHGSSEGVGTPVPMGMNDDMGPRTSGGTFQDALECGLRVGAVASNDGPGLPGTWNEGIAGVWATELTRDGIWEAIRNRRTYGVTGDRISLWWELDGEPMGSVVDSPETRTARVSVDCPQQLDRVEAVHNGQVVDTYKHKKSDGLPADDVYRTVIEVGWGPAAEYGDFEKLAFRWAGTIQVCDGDLRRVWPRFVGLGQEFERTDDGCHFNLVTSRGEGEDEEGILPESQSHSYRQALVLEYTCGKDTELVVDFDEHDEIAVPHGTMVERTHLFPFLDESWQRLETEFDLSRDDVRNEDVVYHNARKVRVCRSIPRAACRTGVTFESLPIDHGQNYYYVRVTQTDGQCAWSSPIWIEH